MPCINDPIDQALYLLAKAHFYRRVMHERAVLTASGEVM